MPRDKNGSINGTHKPAHVLKVVSGSSMGHILCSLLPRYHVPCSVLVFYVFSTKRRHVTAAERA